MMKNIFILMSVLLLNVSASVQAQEEYESLIDGDRCWSSYNNHPDPSLTRIYKEEKICGPDTLINGMRFRRLWSRTWKENEGDFGNWAPDIWIGQDGGRIYWYNKTTYSALYFIMDFSANVGDTVRTGFVNDLPDVPYKVIAVSDTILESDMTHKRRKCLYVQEIAFERNVDIWVSGIGSLKHSIKDTNIYTSYPTLIKYSVNGDVVYQYKGSATTGLTETGTSENTANAIVCIYDMSGKLLKTLQLPLGEKMENIRVPRLGTGIFLYTLMVDGCEIDTKRVIISK